MPYLVIPNDAESVEDPVEDPVPDRPPLREVLFESRFVDVPDPAGVERRLEVFESERVVEDVDVVLEFVRNRFGRLSRRFFLRRFVSGFVVMVPTGRRSTADGPVDRAPAMLPRTGRRPMSNRSELSLVMLGEYPGGTSETGQ